MGMHMVGSQISARVLGETIFQLGTRTEAKFAHNDAIVMGCQCPGRLNTIDVPSMIP
jgi:hypothetical protein